MISNLGVFCCRRQPNRHRPLVNEDERRPEPPIVRPSVEPGNSNDGVTVHGHVNPAANISESGQANQRPTIVDYTEQGNY